MVKRTYLSIIFNTEGERPSEIISRLQSLGFKPITGSRDLVYEWEDHATVSEAISLIDRVHATLGGYNVLFTAETIDER
ncbi:MAG: hypothetical protein AMDU3_IPLC00004G0390 [Thermoplasmatales archaeon I-plasma]|jgi:hypothetical protein|nr:MAG: hypothetical protein AMDU3_IPLC00004G0390 [Thermoplasmatales archaeon I-plasma]MCL4450240.1 hypothetical protein [Candidatus Thermoplasmatota archaeon]